MSNFATRSSIRNSTQRSVASSYNLVLEDVSIIPSHEEHISFDEIESLDPINIMEEENMPDQEEDMELTNVDHTKESLQNVESRSLDDNEFERVDFND